MDLNWLRDFECLGRTLNFTRAAEERNITQSAFSRRIKALESWVGLPLVDRATYPVRLSEAGAQFLPVAKAAIADLSESRQMIRDQDRGDRQQVRFSVLHTISVHYLSSKIDDLARELPHLRTRVISDSLSACCQMLHDGAVEFLLCYRHADVAPTLDEGEFARKDILTDRMVPVAARDAVRRHGWSLPGTPDQTIPYLAYEHSSFLGVVMEHLIGNRPLHLDMVYVDGLVEAIKRRVLAGSGMAWLPETAISRELDQGIFVPVGGREWETAMTLSIYAAPDRLDPVSHEVWSRF
ncbi:MULTISPECIES: LysR family transcriptional regulator [unclassified Roseovarius]|uniref:LysR family transcriptional regulator n=1 Tax=unclassified Roseovarius TaxID=2614913 RepID=UPI00273F4FD4|nr:MULTISPECIES: LysR family transcriptional regulator [unclassified Roseovarius]